MRIVQPDTGFLKELIRDCGDELKTCMQCGACTAVCNLSEGDNPFPRKQMMWASWGQKEALMGDPDIWLCHQCGDCTLTCPRGVKPGNILAVLRGKAIEEHSVPRFLARFMSKPRWLAATVLLPAAIIFLILGMAGHLQIPEGEVIYARFFPHAWLNGTFGLLSLLALIGMALGIRNYWQAMNAHAGEPAKGSRKPVWPAIKEALLHRKYAACGRNWPSTIAHISVVLGFLILLIVTAYAILSVMYFEYPLSQSNPFKIMANIGAGLLLLGTLVLIMKRLIPSNRVPKARYPDWFFLIGFLLLIITGVLLEFARAGNWQYAYHLYFFHLVLVWMVILYAPWSKFSHAMYRLVAMRFVSMRTKSEP